MDPEQFEAIVAQLRGLNSSGTLNTSDLSVLQNAILGVLTDTYRPPQIGKTTDTLIADYAPDLFDVANTGDELRKEIAGRVMRNEDLFNIKAVVRARLEEMPVTDGAPLNEEYLSLVDTYKNQWQAFQKAERANEADRREADPFLKYGLPAFEERYEATDVYRDAFEKLGKDYSEAPFKQKQYPPGQKPSTAKSLVAAKSSNQEYRDSIGFMPLLRTLYTGTNKKPSATKKPVSSEQSVSKKQMYAPGEKVRGGPFDLEKAKLAGNSPERMKRVAEAMVAMLQSRIDESGNTPLKDELTKRGIFAAAAAKPKATATAKPKNYTVKGSEVVRLGE